MRQMKEESGLVVMPCPHCLEIVCKDDGCEHVKCRTCSKDFCFQCSCKRSPTLAHGTSLMYNFIFRKSFPQRALQIL